MSNLLKSLMKLSLFSFLIVFTMTGCGGGGGGGDAGPAPGPTPTTAVTISGTVSGTEIIVYDDTTQSIRIRTTAQGSGTNKTFSFTVPVPGSYRFYLLENAGSPNEAVYPLYMGTTNAFAFDSNVPTTLNLGHVSTVTGYAIPQYTFFGPGVTVKTAIETVPSQISNSLYSIPDIVGFWQMFGLSTKNGLNY